MYRISGLHQSYCPVSLLVVVYCSMCWLERDFRPSICSVCSSLQTRIEIYGCFLSEVNESYLWEVLELEVSIIQSCFEKNLCYSGSMCYSNILSLCLIKVRDLMWKYCSKMSVHFITKRQNLVFESEIIFSSYQYFLYIQCKNYIVYKNSSIFYLVWSVGDTN